MSELRKLVTEMARDQCPDECLGRTACGYCYPCRARAALLVPTFAHGSDEFHVLRLIGNDQISAAKGAELLSALQRGERPDLLPFTSGI